MFLKKIIMLVLGLLLSISYAFAQNINANNTQKHSLNAILKISTTKISISK